MHIPPKTCSYNCIARDEYKCLPHFSGLVFSHFTLFTAVCWYFTLNKIINLYDCKVAKYSSRIKTFAQHWISSHSHTDTAAAFPFGFRYKVWAAACGLLILRASGPQWPLEMTGWQLADSIGVGDCSAGSVLPCDSLLVSLHGEQRGTCVSSTLGIEGNKKKKKRAAATHQQLLCHPSSLFPKQTILFFPWMASSLRAGNTMSVCLRKKREAEKKTGCWIIHIPYGGWHSRSSQNQSWRLDGIMERRENGKHCCGSMAWCSHKYVFMALNELGHKYVWCSHRYVCETVWDNASHHL